MILYYVHKGYHLYLEPNQATLSECHSLIEFHSILVEINCVKANCPIP